MPDFSRLAANRQIQKFLLILGFCAFFAANALASDHENTHEAAAHTADSAHHDAAKGEHKEGKMDPGKLIMEHISDSHDWHLWGHTAIPLPVIVYTGSKGLTMFLSSKFEHGHAAYEGFRLDEKNKIIWDDAANTEKIYDFSLTKNVVAMLVASITLLIIMLNVAKIYRRRAGQAPKGFLNLLEPLIIFLRDDVAKSSIGPRYERFMPMLLTIFFFIFINNIFGLIPIFPGGANVTGNIAVTMVLALVVFITVNLSGNKYYWKHIFLPDVPKAMYIILIPIEILGVILKPFVLMLRLFANITAGHIIILGFFSLIFIFGAMNTGLGYAVSPLSVGFTLFMSFLEMLVAFLQAFVFTLLTAIYLGMAVEEHHHAEHH